MIPNRFDISDAIYRPLSTCQFDTPDSKLGRPEYSTLPPTSKSNVPTRSSVRQSTIEANQRDAAALRRRRERNRLHQARYKRNQDTRMAATEDNIRHLQDEIHKLQLQRQLLTIAPGKKNSWSTAVEYFRLFRFGVHPSTSVAPLHASTEKVSRIDRQVQWDFLLATMAPDVTDGTVVGLDAVMETWEFTALCFPDLRVDLVRLENGPNDSIVATTQQNLTISKMLLRYGFPHLSRPESKCSHIVDKLIGQQILIRSAVHFKWDSKNDRVRSFVFKSDMVTPLLHLLGNLEDVAHVFSKARLTPEFEFVRGADQRIELD
ncbi:hypothetical protein PHMEG_00016452 [Phytophthora megakarya]|uniref:BZIP domain-containing protein n=1 Tax=Phytophthora megakarya TaxID=4795 RepID=A0A225VZA3_9STRA|nr:hypothetical protein PHMEG_00016452 [Phytophthora megakarya]